MRIALISHSSLYWTREYATSLADQGHVVRVLSFSREPLDGIDVHFVGRDTPGRFKALSYLVRVPRLRSMLRAFSPDVVLATYVSSNGLAAALCRPNALVISAHGTDVYGARGNWLRRRTVRFACSRAAAVHAVSEPLADALVGFGVPAGRIQCFPIGIDLTVFTPGAPRESGGGTLPQIVCTRRQEPVYGNEIVVSALALLRDRGTRARASLVGGGPLLEARRRQVERLELQESTTLTGQIPLDEVRRILQEADIYVTASRSDGASSSLLEALACGLFPVAAAIPANEAWIDDGVNGLLFRVGDERALADALERAVVDSDLRRAARAGNRARVAAEGDIAANMRRMGRLLEDAASAAST